MDDNSGLSVGQSITWSVQTKKSQQQTIGWIAMKCNTDIHGLFLMHNHQIKISICL